MLASVEDIPRVVMTKEEILNLPLGKYLQQPVILNIFKPEYENIDQLLDLALELQDWVPPAHFQDMASYKFAGYDTQNRPIWTCKFGDYSIKEIIENGEVELLERYFWQGIMLVTNSIVAKTPEENPSQQFVGIVDAGDVTHYRKFLHGPSLSLMYKMTKKYKEGAMFMLGLAVIVNLKKSGVVNFILKFLKPLIWNIMERVELYGKDESTWRPRLVELFGTEDIPDFTGTNMGPLEYLIDLVPEKEEARQE